MFCYQEACPPTDSRGVGNNFHEEVAGAKEMDQILQCLPGRIITGTIKNIDNYHRYILAIDSIDIVAMFNIDILALVSIAIINSNG